MFVAASGRVELPRSVAEARARLARRDDPRTYLLLAGDPGYRRSVAGLLSEVSGLPRQRLAVVQSPGGTAALRLAGELLRRSLGLSRVWIGRPTWGNYLGVFAAAGLAPEAFPFSRDGAVCFDTQRAALARIPRGDAVLLQAGAHLPTGCELTPDQWEALAEIIAERALLPVVDFAFPGDGPDLADDWRPLRALARRDVELLVTLTWSKVMGLYGERVGALVCVGRTPQGSRQAQSQAKGCVRTLWSSAPRHGGELVTAILTEPDLRAQWDRELRAMRDQVRRVRRMLHAALAARGHPLPHIASCAGLFAGLPLLDGARPSLIAEHAIYLPASGAINVTAINVTAITEHNIDRFCDAVAPWLQPLSAGRDRWQRPLAEGS